MPNFHTDFSIKETTFSIIQEIEVLARLTKSKFREFQSVVLSDGFYYAEESNVQYVLLNQKIPNGKSLIVTKIELQRMSPEPFGIFEDSIQISSEGSPLHERQNTTAGFSNVDNYILVNNIFLILEKDVYIDYLTGASVGGNTNISVILRGYLVDSKIAKTLKPCQTQLYHRNVDIEDYATNPNL